MCVSEVALLRQQIEVEILAMRNVFSDIALGTARHRFIQTRMERVGAYQDALSQYVGAEKANMVVCELYIQVME